MGEFPLGRRGLTLGAIMPADENVAWRRSFQMLPKEENELVTRVGPGTPMGELMRKYWLPALLSWELPSPDCPPIRLKLLGEQLVAFRDTNGNVGVIDEFCAHRRASLWLGRNEEGGLRCVFHGWKYDVTGQCVDQMNEPESFKDKIKLASYATSERGGVIWTYMGRGTPPPPPDFEYTRVSERHREVNRVWQESNWLQALEGGLDTSHAPILHRAMKAGAGITMDTAFVRGGAPSLEVDITDYGYRYAGVRPLVEDQQYVRGYHFVMPFTQIRPSQNAGRGQERTVISGHHWVPIDDENCMVWNWDYSYGSEELSESERGGGGNGGGNGPQYVDYANEFRAKGNPRNNWLIDREMQRTVNFTGIRGINAQDRAVQESMGPIVDRSLEHLGPADKAIIAMRRLMLEAIKVVEDGGTPRGVAASYYDLRAYEKVLPRTLPWRDVLDPEMYQKGATASRLT
ncbi:MAG: Rieske 2Fe-2S domain-containing protein [Dehalococcoidia bacterium]|nr:Rieske 2Fe-2S domain-containing protein [Dehalococcoidia bacterium]